MTGSGPVITPTAHPLVFLYSAPPCQPGLKMTVQFQSPPGDLVKTPGKPCSDGRTMNFYLAGLRTGSQHLVRHIVESNLPETVSDPQPGPEMTLTVPEVIVDRAPIEVMQQPPDSHAAGVILHGPLNDLPTATDLHGNLLWFYPEYLTYLTRAEAGGYFYGISDNHEADTSGQFVRKFDVAGITIAETNAARVNEQLVAIGQTSDHGLSP